MQLNELERNTRETREQIAFARVCLRKRERRSDRMSWSKEKQNFSLECRIFINSFDLSVWRREK